MDPWTVPKIMTVCITLINSVRLVSSAQPSKGTSHTSQNQSSAVSQSSTKPNTTGTPANHKPTGNPSQTSGSGTQVNTNNGQPKDTTPKPVSASGSNSSVLRSQSSIPAEPNQARQISSKNENLTTINSSFPEFKIVTLDPSDNTKTKENDTSQYNFKVTSYLITYKFKSNSRCSEVMFGGKSLWKYDHDKHKGNFPTYIFAHTDIKKVYVRTTNSLFVYSLDDQTLSDSSVNAVRLDIKSEKTIDEYFYSKDEKTKLVTFTAKDNVVFQELIKKKGCLSCGSDKTLYEAKFYNEAPFKVVVEGLGSKNEKLTLYLVNGRVLTLTKANDYSYSTSWVAFGPLGLKIVTEGSTYFNDSTKYDIFEVGDIFDYIFKPGSKCNELILKDKSIWKHKFNEPYPKSLSYDLGLSRFLFNFGDQNVVYKKVEREWKYATTKLLTVDIKSRESTINYSFSNYNTNFGTYTAKKGYGFSSVKHDKTEIWQASNNEYAIRVKRDGAGTCRSLQQMDIELVNGDILKYIKIGGCCSKKQWIHDYTKKGLSKQVLISPNNIDEANKNIHLVELDLNVTKTTDQFDYTKTEEKSNVGTYIAKKGYGFSKIIQKKHFCNFCGSDEVVWEADKNNEHAVKLLIDGVGAREGTREVQIYLDNGDILKYTKTGYCCSKQWFLLQTKLHVTQSKSSASESVTPVSQPSLQGSSSSPKVEESKDSKTTPTQVAQEAKESKHAETATKVEDSTPKTTPPKKEEEDPKPKTATPVTQDSTPKPKGSAQPESSTTAKPTTPSVTTSTVVEGSKESTIKTATPKTSSRDQDASISQTTPTSSPESVNLVVLDVSKKESCNEYEYFNDDSAKTETFTAKQNYKFKQVNYGNDVKWEAKNNKYHTKVVLATDDQGKITIKFDAESQQKTTPDSQYVEEHDDGDDSFATPVTPKSTQPLQHPSSLKISTENSTSENDTTKYTLKQYDNFLKFEFKDDAKCTKIVWVSNTLYEYGKSHPENKYPKEIYFNSGTKYVYIGLYETKFVPRYGINEWKCETGTTNKKLEKSKFKIITQGTDGKTKENNSTHYDDKNEGSFVKCEFKDGAKCTEVKYDAQQVYKYDVNQNGGKHPKCLYFHKLMMIIFAEFENDLFVFLRFDLDSKNWESENLDKMQNLDTNKFKVLTPDPNDDDKDKENDTDSIEKKSIGSLVCYLVKKDVGYYIFKYESDVVISLFNYHGRPKFKEMYFLLDSKKNLVFLEDKSLYVLKR